MIEKAIRNIVASHLDARGIERDDAGLLKETGTIFPLPQDINAESIEPLAKKEIEDKLIETAHNLYDAREKQFGSAETRLLERLVMLRIIESLWVEHLTVMDEMRLGIGMEAVAQRDPLVAYKNRGHESFQTLLDTIESDVVHTIFHVVIKKEPAKAAASPMARAAQSPMAKAANRDNVNKPAALTGNKKPGRNDPCSCGSGKKYKHCCGK